MLVERISTESSLGRPEEGKLRHKWSVAEESLDLAVRTKETIIKKRVGVIKSICM